MTDTPHEAQPPETPIEAQPTGRATLLGDDPAGREELVVEHLEDRVLMSSDAAAALAPPETVAPAPAAYVGSQQPGERTAGGPSGSGGSAVIESRAPLGEAVDAAADATAEIAHGEGESRGAAGGTPGNPQAPSHNEPKEPAELTEIKSEVPEKIEPLIEHGEKHEPSAEREGSDHEGDGSGATHGNARTRSVALAASDEARAGPGSEAMLASDEPNPTGTNTASTIDPNVGESAVETKLEVVAQVDLASLRQPRLPAALPDQSLGGDAATESLNSSNAQGMDASESRQSPAEAAPAASSVEVPRAHDAVFDRVASQGVADAVQVGTPVLAGGDASAQGAAAARS